MAENNDELEAKLEAAGIKNDSSKANAILAKLKDKQNLQK